MSELILLTGGTGFLGSHAARRALDRGAQIVMLRRSTSRDAQIDAVFEGRDWRSRIDCRIAPGPAALPAFVEEIAPDAVIHTAAMGGAVVDATEMPAIIETNVTIGSMLLEGLSRLKKTGSPSRPFIFCGSFWQHADGTPQYRANTFYAASKSAFEAFADYYRTTSGLRVLGLKFYDIYGANDLRNRAIDLLIDATTAEEPIPFTKGDQIIAPLAVEDAVDAIFRAIELAREREPDALTYAAAGAEQHSLREIADMIEAQCGRKPRIDWGRLPYRASQIFHPAEMPSLPGWTPKISIAGGIRNLLASRLIK